MQFSTAVINPFPPEHPNEHLYDRHFLLFPVKCMLSYGEKRKRTRGDLQIIVLYTRGHVVLLLVTVSEEPVATIFSTKEP
jgi:hypothetical protein